LPDDHRQAIAEEYADASAPDGEVIYTTRAPITPDGVVAVSGQSLP